MKMALATWSFPYCSLPEVVGITKALGLDAVDMGIDYKASVGREALLADPKSTGLALRDYNVDMPCFYYRFGENLDERNIAHPAFFEENLTDFEKIISFCLAAGIKTVFILPGVVNPGQSVADAIEVAAKAFNAFIPIAVKAGIALTFEPHVRSITESPSVTLNLLDRVPGLKLTLDYSHFVCLGFRQEDIDPLAVHAAHIHLRQAKPGELQAKFDEGTLNFPAMIGTLTEVGYDGYLVLENVHQTYMNSLYDDVLTEVIRMRDLVARYI